MPKPSKTVMLPIANIEATAATQIRLRKDPFTIKAYAEDLEDGAVFPPIDVYCEDNSERYILADGFHRLHAFVDTGRTEIQVNVFRGGMHEALIHALGANHSHGLRLTNADKRNAVAVALKDPKISELSLREIGDICRVSHMTVARILNEQTLEHSPSKERHNKAGERPAPPSDKDLKVKHEASQGQVETVELADALAVIKSFPYQGGDAVTRMTMDRDLVADAEYVSCWCTDLVLAYRKAVKLAYHKAVKDAK